MEHSASIKEDMVGCSRVQCVGRQWLETSRRLMNGGCGQCNGKGKERCIATEYSQPKVEPCGAYLFGGRNQLRIVFIRICVCEGCIHHSVGIGRR